MPDNCIKKIICYGLHWDVSLLWEYQNKTDLQLAY